jgi:class III poly(R)-hydroxyalkanoic acid synthase PhaE subunit
MNTQWPGSGEFETLARQYWSAWGDAMRNGAPSSAAAGNAMPGWQEAIDWWSRSARSGNPAADAMLDRFNAQARDWYGQMQQVAAQFAGQQASASDIAASWKRALGGLGENPFGDMFQAMRGQGAQGIEQWMEAARPYLDAWRKESSGWLGLPTFGIGREQQQRWQQLAQAQLDYQQHDAAFNALLLKASQRAYAVFEDKLRERAQPGRQLTSARALFDLWIDAAEEAYAEVALSSEFRAAYGARVNAQMRLRQAVQGEIERTSALFGMPTRSDLDSAFRKIADLERALRAVRDQVQSSPTGRSGAAAGKPAAAAASDGGSGKDRDAGRAQGEASAKAAAAASPKAASRSASAKAGASPAAPLKGAPSKGAPAKGAAAKAAPEQGARAKTAPAKNAPAAKTMPAAASTAGKRASASAPAKGGKR